MQIEALADVDTEAIHASKIPHYLCRGTCLPEVGGWGRTVCGTKAQFRGVYGRQSGVCVVCQDIWDNGFYCTVCGYRNWGYTEHV